MNNKTLYDSNWITQQELANQLGIRVQNVNNWIRRNKIAFKEYEFLPGQKIILVDPNSITVNSLRNKGQFSATNVQK